MKFTPLQIITISEIAGYSELFGLPFNVKIDDSDEFVNNLKESLEKKDIIKDDNLTEIGVMMAMLVKAYNTSNIHLFINRSRLAIDGDSVIAFTKEENMVEVVKKHKVKAIEDIVMNNEYLRKAQKKSFFKPQVVECSEEKWIDEELDKYPNFLIIQKFKNKILNRHICLAWSDNNSCCYDYVNHTLLELGPKDLRVCLLNLFEVEVDD